MKLRNFLLSSLSSVAHGSNKRIISNHEYCYRIAQAWNAYRSGGKTKLSYYPDKPVPALK
jgi:hypothetical protein